MVTERSGVQELQEFRSSGRKERNRLGRLDATTPPRFPQRHSFAVLPNETDNLRRFVVEIDGMSDVVPKIGQAIEGYKAREQDIIGLGHRAYKDLFSAANAATLTSVVQSLIQRSYSELVGANSARTSLLAAISQQHAEIMAGCRVLTEDAGILRALIDAANAATTEAFRLIYAERQEIAAPIDTGKRAQKSAPSLEPASVKKTRRSVKKPAAKKLRTSE